jgi:hypothetical protein
VPKFLRACPPQDDGEARKARRLAGARHAPADWSERARVVALSWDGLGVPAVAARLAAMRTRRAAGCTGSTPTASTGSVTGPVRDASGGSPRRSGRRSSRWPARCRRGGWCAMGPGSCPLGRRRARRSGRWIPSLGWPGRPASRWDAARSGGSCGPRRCAGAVHAPGPPAPTRSLPQKDPHRGAVHCPAAGLHGDLRR